MGQIHLRFRETFSVSPEALWARLIDHAGMTRWTDATVTLKQDPSGDGGVGAIRLVKARGFTIEEEVVYADAPRRLVYRIKSGLPNSFHRGEMLIEPWGEKGAELSWDILMSSAIPGFMTFVEFLLKSGIRESLANLRQLVEAEADREARASKAA